MSNTLRFKTHAQIKNIIGKDLIYDDNIAILELVKNSFDANAKAVTLAFKNIKQNDDFDLLETVGFTNLTSRLIITDDGTGMSFNDVKDKWLNIAYSDKKSEATRHKRRMAGAKGIGRFSCDSLGEYLNLYTKQENDSKYFLLKIDWKKFEEENDKDKEIQSIELEYEYLNEGDLKKIGIKPFNTGVVLEIIKLRKQWSKKIEKKNVQYWNTQNFVGLKKYLEKLINPNQAFEINDFGIYLETPEFRDENYQKPHHEKFIGKIENRIFEKLDFKTTSIESKIVKNGREIITELKDKGETVFRIREKNIYYPFLKDVKVTINYLNPYAKAFFIG